ncbi:cyclic-di-AMP-binding protein CbpB [Sutcliffiella rhizosphaerae]|uniref:CBS domain-containing protein YkuL n=1 Tax=Sutcliffiella rhizosphaerae TaxID=2880967 RepID=A0ABM8YJ11_9BACI|nr:cyclic-di-AMP-binding protein CbpB [Sutcliffiella rhizosphaerae]CAG9619903.1 CBS domain-containing protein YkuL [Sutcliffiella rhizosphaerae]
MISLQSSKVLGATIKDLIIPAERVAHVQVKNNLEHALLVLTKTGYTAVPVLDAKYKLHGLISITHIMDSILGLERIEFERLEHMVVEEAMNKELASLSISDTVEKGLELLVDHPFVCVLNDENIFEGILTRRTILDRLHTHFINNNKEQDLEI